MRTKLHNDNNKYIFVNIEKEYPKPRSYIRNDENLSTVIGVCLILFIIIILFIYLEKRAIIPLFLILIVLLPKFSRSCMDEIKSKIRNKYVKTDQHVRITTKEAKKIIWNVFLDRKPELFLLYLRQFASLDAKQYRKNMKKEYDLLQKYYSGQISFTDVQREFGSNIFFDKGIDYVNSELPIIGLGSEDTIPVANTKMMYVFIKDKYWRTVVTKSCIASHIIFLRPSVKSGTQWEMTTIIKNQVFLNKTIFIIMSPDDLSVLKQRNMNGLERIKFDEAATSPLFINYPLTKKLSPIVAKTGTERNLLEDRVIRKFKNT